MWGATVKSFSETHPDDGVARASLDVQVYDDGKLHACAAAPAVDTSSAMAADRRLGSIAALFAGNYARSNVQKREGRSASYRAAHSGPGVKGLKKAIL